MAQAPNMFRGGDVTHIRVGDRPHSVDVIADLRAGTVAGQEVSAVDVDFSHEMFEAASETRGCSEGLISTPIRAHNMHHLVSEDIFGELNVKQFLRHPGNAA